MAYFLSFAMQAGNELSAGDTNSDKQYKVFQRSPTCKLAYDRIDCGMQFYTDYGTGYGYAPGKTGAVR